MTQVLQGSTPGAQTYVNTRLQFGKQLESLGCDTDHVVNVIDVQTSQKLWNTMNPTSNSLTSVIWNQPSISGNHMARRLNFTGSCTFPLSGTTFPPTAPSGGHVVGTGPSFWNILQSTMDYCILSKAAYRRSYTINNSATVIIENMTPELCDALIAVADQEKLRDLKMEVMPQCNFFPMGNTCGEELLTAANATTMTLNAIPPLDTINGVQQFGSYAFNRNKGSYITGIVITHTNSANSITTSSTVPGWEGIAIPVNVSDGTVYYGNLIETVTISFNEDLISSYFYNNYMDEKIIWNKDLPASSFNIKLDIDTQYLQRALKFHSVLRSSNTYFPVTVGTPTFNNLQLNYLSYGVPDGLDLQQSYKLLVYVPNIYQAPTVMNYSGNPSYTWSGQQNYSSLSRIAKYMLFYANINQSTVSQVFLPGNAYPSTLNLPITNLTGTFNSDSQLFTFSLTQRELQERTLKNLSQDKYLHDQIVGKRFSISELVNDAPTSQDGNMTVSDSYTTGGAGVYSGQSNNNYQFYILKLGEDLRIPSNLAPTELVNYNLNLTASCYVGASNAPVIRGDMNYATAMLTNGAGTNGSSLVGNVLFNVYFFTPQVVRVSNNTLDYVDINTDVNNYQEAQAKFIQGLSRDKEIILNMDMMVGGGFFAPLKNGIQKVIGSVPGVLKHARTAVDVAKHLAPFVPAAAPFVQIADSGLSHFGYGKKKPVNHRVRYI